MLLTQDNNIDKLSCYNIIHDINFIVPFKITDDEIAGWVMAMYRLYPEVTPELIAKITDKFISGDFEFNRNIGIVNYMMKIRSYLGKFSDED